MTILGNCTEPLRREIDSMKKPKELDEFIQDRDAKGLMDAIEGTAFHTTEDSGAHEPWMQQSAWRRMMLVTQENEDLEAHGQEWKAECRALEKIWGRLQPHKLVGSGMSTEDQIAASDKFKACLFLGSVDQHKCKKVIDDLHTNKLNKIDNYPPTADAMISHLKKRRDVSGGHS